MKKVILGLMCLVSLGFSDTKVGGKNEFFIK